jgi:uncharacterized membrane-anchored protein YitT (DUF2179 family)
VLKLLDVVESYGMVYTEDNMRIIVIQIGKRWYSVHIELWFLCFSKSLVFFYVVGLKTKWSELNGSKHLWNLISSHLFINVYLLLLSLKKLEIFHF